MALYIRRDEFVKTVLGPAVPGAQVYVVNQPANTTSLPPSPLATIYGDSDGITQLQQPLITDGFGHTYFYAAPNVYTIVVADNGALQQIYPDQSLGSGISLQTNGTPNTVQSIENLVAGANITLTPDGFGATVIDATGGSALELEVNGTPNADQSLLNLESTSTVTVTDNGAGNVSIAANTAAILTGVLDYLVSSYIWQANGYGLNGGAVAGSLVGSMDFASGGTSTATQSLPSSYHVSVSFGVNKSHGFQEQEFSSNQGPITIGILSAWECLLAFQSDDTARHWVGFGTCRFANAIDASGSMDFNDFVGHGSFNAPDFVGFRFSPAPGANDSHWQAYVGGVALGSSTIADTGIAPTFDGVGHTLKITSDGTNFKFYVDGVLGATIVIPSLYKGSFSGATDNTTNGSFMSIVQSDTDYMGGGTVDWNLVAVGYTL